MRPARPCLHCTEECNNPDINQDVFIPKPRDPTYIEEQFRLGPRDPKDRDIGILGPMKQGPYDPWDLGMLAPKAPGGPLDLGIVDPGSLSRAN